MADRPPTTGHLRRQDDAAADAAEPAPRTGPQAVRPHYLEALALVERLHRRLLDVVKDEFDRRERSDITAVQALLLYNIGADDLTTAELRARGYYLGANLPLNLKKLVETGFLSQQAVPGSAKQMRVALTDKGREIHDAIAELYAKHIGLIEQIGGVNAADFRSANASLLRLERFWGDQIRFRL